VQELTSVLIFESLFPPIRHSPHTLWKECHHRFSAMTPPSARKALSDGADKFSHRAPISGHFSLIYLCWAAPGPRSCVFSHLTDDIFRVFTCTEYFPPEAFSLAGHSTLVLVTALPLLNVFPFRYKACGRTPSAESGLSLSPPPQQPFE